MEGSPVHPRAAAAAGPQRTTLKLGLRAPAEEQPRNPRRSRGEGGYSERVSDGCGLMGPHGVHCWASCNKRDIELLQRDQRRAVELLKTEQQLKVLGGLSLEKRSLRRDLPSQLPERVVRHWNGLCRESPSLEAFRKYVPCDP